MEMMLFEIAKALDIPFSKEQNPDVKISSVSFDSRKIGENTLFIPLIGERDGHDFIETAKENGAVATLFQVGHPNQPTDFPTLVVKDPLKSLQDLAKYYLKKVNPRVVAVTGSNGKTTTKDMIAAVLKPDYNVYATVGNFNNEIGVPVTILGMKMNTEILVVEMGMDRPGQLEFLSSLVEPDVALITMIGEAHIEFFGTREKITAAKMEIVDSLKEDGKFFYNGDEPLLVAASAEVTQVKGTFGFDSNNTVFATDFVSERTSTTFHINDSDVEFEIPLIGKHNVANALAAILVGHNFHVKDEKIRQALVDFSLTKDRMEWIKGANGEEILSDVYNANPTAVKASLKSFVDVEQYPQKDRVVVLADMLELGDQAPTLHAQLADNFDPDKIDEVFLYGDLMEYLKTPLEKKFGKNRVHFYHKLQQDELIKDLKKTLKPGDSVMLKGSNSMNLGRVVDSLK